MKIRTPKLVASLAAGWITAAGALAQEATLAPISEPANPAATNQSHLPGPSSTNASTASNTRPPGLEGTRDAPTDGLADKGLTINFRGAPLDTVLRYLADSAGFTIIRDVDTRQAGTVDMMSSKPLGQDEIVALLNKTLARNGLTAVQDGKNLEIETEESAIADDEPPVKVFPGDYHDVPADALVETEIIPLHSLNPTQLARDLFTLRPRDAEISANEGGNAIIMTAKRADIRRFTHIIQALDSSGDGALNVFLLTYADSKAIADELKDVFASADNNNQQANPPGFSGGPGGGPGGGRGGFGGGGNNGTGNTESARRSAIKVNAVSDDQNNAVLVSAPTDVMPDISNLIAKLDIPQDDMVQIRVFHLVHSDPSDIATELATVFPDPNSSASQGGGSSQRMAAQFGGGGPGGFGGPFGNAGTGSGTDGQSSRALKQSTVYSTQDARTQSIIVTASKETMVQIAKMIEDLDANAARTQRVYVYRPRFVDVVDLQSPLQDLFMSSSGRSSSSSSIVNALQSRAQQAAQSSTITQTSGSSSLGSSGSRSSGP